jgi:stage V sporulation protein B
MNRMHGVVLIGLSNVLFIIVGYLTNIWLGRYLGPEQYGVYGVLTALMTAMNIMQVSGIPQAVSRFVAEKRDSAEAVLKSGLRIQLLSTVVVGLIFFLLAPEIANIFHDHNFIDYCRLMSLVFPAYGIFALYSGYYNGLHNFRRQALMQTAYSTSKLIFVIGLAISFSIYGIIAGFILAPLVAILFGFKAPRTKNIFSRRQIITYSLPLIGFAILVTLQLSVDLFSLKAIARDSKVAGYYTAAQSIAIIIYFGLSAIGQILFPSISSYVSAGNLTKARLIIENSFRYLLIILIPIATLMAATTNELIKLLYGQEYSASATPLLILIIGYVFLTIFAMLANALNGAGRAKNSMLFAAIGLSTTIICCLILIPKFEAIGAALSASLGSFVSMVLVCINTYRVFKFKFYFASLIRILISSSIILVGLLLVPTTIYVLPIYYLAFGFLYLVFLYFLNEFNNEEINNFKKLIPLNLKFLRPR